MASGDTKTEAMLNALGNGGSADEFRGCCNTKTQQYILDAIDRVQNVEDEVEELKNNPDVVDIVDTYADLQAYDTTHLSDNDIIRVLADETHSGNSTYYKFNKQAGTWTFIGEIAGGSITPVQTPGASQTDVMSQNAVTSMVFADPSDSTDNIRIGNSNPTGMFGVNIGGSASQSITTQRATNIGGGSGVIATGGTAIGNNAYVNNTSYVGSVALGAYSRPTSAGQVHIGTTQTQYGYNSTNYRLLSGVHDPVNAHDAATKGYLDTRLSNLTITTISQSDYNNLQTKDPNTLYIITGA